MLQIADGGLTPIFATVESMDLRPPAGKLAALDMLGIHVTAGLVAQIAGWSVCPVHLSQRAVLQEGSGKGLQRERPTI